MKVGWYVWGESSTVVRHSSDIAGHSLDIAGHKGFFAQAVLINWKRKLQTENQTKIANRKLKNNAILFKKDSAENSGHHT